MYKRGELRRADYEFQPDLSFEEFVLEHFDVWIQGKTGDSSEMGLMNFFMKSISADKNLISIPGIGGDYYEARTNLFRINPWLSKGCVFLSQKISREPVDSLKIPRHCILHTADYFENLTAKPIDCLFHTCETTGKGRVVSEEISKKWLSALESSFPNSVERFQTLIGHKIGEMKDS
ncbi:hypothetical protein KAU04_07110 [bacterium]|nr:hypothetical protein [bacterium]